MEFPELPARGHGFEEIARLCAVATGFDPLQPEEPGTSQLLRSVRLQLCGVAMSLFHLNKLKHTEKRPDVVTEHSMGIYAALVACGSLGDGAVLELASRIGTCVARLGEKCDYAFGSIVGLTETPLASIARNNSACIVNHNTSRHFLLCGRRESIDCAAKEAVSAGAFSANAFPCDAPLHTPLIESIAEDLEHIIRDYEYFPPRIPLVDHLAQRQLTAADIPQFLMEDLCSPVYWEKTYQSLRKMGTTTFVEVGFGQALSKFNRWIDSES